MKRWINTKVVIDIKTGRVLKRDGFWYEGPMALATTPPYMEVTNWAFYNDGTESGSVIIGSVNTNPSLDVNTICLARFGLEETSGNASKDTAPQIQYNKNAGGWNNVTATSSVVQAVATDNIADEDDTTQRITSFTFDTTNLGFDEVDGIAGGKDADLNNTGFEALFAFQIIGDDVDNGDTIVLKIVDSNNSDADYDQYNQTDPSITVVKATLVQFASSINAASNISDITASINRPLASSISAGSNIGDISLLISRPLNSSLNATTLTSDIDLINLVQFASSIQGVSNTSDISLLISRALSSAVNAGSLTGDIGLLILRELNSSINATTLISDIELSISGLIEFASAVNATSSTNTISLLVNRPLASSVVGQSQTNDIFLLNLMALASAVNAQTATSDIELSISGLIEFASLVQAVSDISDISLAVSRALSSVVNGQSNTGDIELLISGLIEFASAVNAVSSTSDILLNIKRILSSGISGQTITGQTQLLILRDLASQIDASTLVSAIDILTGDESYLGVVIDPSIVSATVIRAFESVSQDRDFESKTVLRTISEK